MSLYPGFLTAPGGGGSVATWAATSSGFAVPSGVTFARTGAALAIQGASWAAGVYTSVASGSPRWERLPDGSVGWLIEGARTNLFLYSQDFTQSAWVQLGGGSFGTGVADPAGGTTAHRLTGAVATYGALVRQLVTLTGSVQYAQSLLVKTGDFDYLTMRVGGNDTGGGSLWPVFKLSDGTSTVNGAANSSFVDLGLINGAWRRVGHVALMQGSPGNEIDTGLAGSNGDPSVSDATHTGVWWQAQLEQAAYPSSPIVTAGATATRNAETASGSVSGTDGGFAFWVQFRTPPGAKDYQIIRLVGSGNEHATIYRDSTKHVFCDVYHSGVAQAFIDLGVVADSTIAKVALRVASGNYGASLNGGAVVAITSGANGTSPQGMTTGYFGHDAANGNPFDGHLIGLGGWGSSWYPSTISDTALRAL